MSSCADRLATSCPFGHGGSGITSTDDDRLLRYGSATSAQSDSGHLTEHTDAGGTTLCDYSVSGELRRVDQPGGRTIEHEYDALRRKVDDAYTHSFLYAGNINPVAEGDAAGNTLNVAGVVSELAGGLGAAAAAPFSPGGDQLITPFAIGFAESAASATSGLFDAYAGIFEGI